MMMLKLKNKPKTGHNLGDFVNPKPLSEFHYRAPDATATLILLSNADPIDAYALKHSTDQTLVIYPSKKGAEALVRARRDAVIDVKKRNAQISQTRQDALREVAERQKLGFTPSQSMLVRSQMTNVSEPGFSFGEKLYSVAMLGIMIPISEVKKAIDSARSRAMLEFGGLPLVPQTVVLSRKGGVTLSVVVKFV